MIIPFLAAGALFAFAAWFIWLAGWWALLVPAGLLVTLGPLCLACWWGFVHREHPGLMTARDEPRRREIEALRLVAVRKASDRKEVGA